MNERDATAARFEEHRGRLRAVAYRMLGSMADADDAVQEAWVRLDRFAPTAVDNVAGWLTTVVARVCLDMLRSRKAHGEQSLRQRFPDPVVSFGDTVDPEHEALIGDAVGMALMVVLETLSPAERVAFVLHDVFAVPYGSIAPIVARSESATRKLASRARAKVRRDGVRPNVDLTTQRTAVDAFLRAARRGDFTALVETLSADVVVRADTGVAELPRLLRGREQVARQAEAFGQAVDDVRIGLVNGAAGLVAYAADGDPFSVLAITVRDQLIVEIDILADRERLHSVLANSHIDDASP
jgi:RNA polymerase sigma-70 factor (ECF subfamily)